MNDYNAANTATIRQQVAWHLHLVFVECDEVVIAKEDAQLPVSQLPVEFAQAVVGELRRGTIQEVFCN
jgi:uncharacterized membrane protein (UPF0127 family)